MRAPSVLVVGPVLVLALVACAAQALAQPVDVNPQAPSAPSEVPGTGELDTGGFLDDLGVSVPVAIAVTIGVGAIVATLAFMGGTKFVNAENVLENDARRSIFEFIRTNPGAHLRATATALDLSTTNVLWHLRKLEGANLVASKKFEGYKVFYPVEGGVASRQRAIAHAVVRNDNAQQILEYILSRPSAHQREIARALGVNHGTIRWHLRKLTESNLLLPIKKDTQTEYYVSELGVQILGELGNATARDHASGVKAAPGAATPAHVAQPVQAAGVAVPVRSVPANGALPRAPVGFDEGHED